MKILTTNLFKIVTPEEGKFLFDGNNTTTIVYTPLDSNPELVWSEVDEEQELLVE